MHAWELTFSTSLQHEVQLFSAGRHATHCGPRRSKFKRTFMDRFSNGSHNRRRDVAQHDDGDVPGKRRLRRAPEVSVRNDILREQKYILYAVHGRDTAWVACIHMVWARITPDPAAAG